MHSICFHLNPYYKDKDNTHDKIVVMKSETVPKAITPLLKIQHCIQLQAISTCYGELIAQFSSCGQLANREIEASLGWLRAVLATIPTLSKH